MKMICWLLYPHAPSTPIESVLELWEDEQVAEWKRLLATAARKQTINGVWHVATSKIGAHVVAFE